MGEPFTGLLADRPSIPSAGFFRPPALSHRKHGPEAEKARIVTLSTQRRITAIKIM